jgi:hypothetical protein
MSLPTIGPKSDQFAYIERLLQVQLNAPQLKVSEAVNVTNPNASTQFEKFCATLQRPNVVVAFVPATRIGQTPAEIATTGIKVDPSAGFHVNLGSFPIDRSADYVEVLQLRIALGTPLNYQAPELAKQGEIGFLESAPAKTALKIGFHSLCTSAANDYLIFNRSQIEAVSYVRFAGGANLAEITSEDILCDACGESEATVWCVNCAAKFCAACDERIHGENAVLTRHERLPLLEARALREFCPEHGERYRFEFYCRTCHESLCEKCKLAGSHSRGPEADHELVSIQDAYNSAAAQIETPEAVFVERRAAIEAKLAECDQMMEEVIANLAQVEEKIAQEVQEMIGEERLISGEKVNVIRSVQTELKRKNAEVEAMERSFADQRRISAPQAFLTATNAQSRIVARLSSNLDLPLDVTSQGDVVVHGSGPLDAVLVRARSRSKSRAFEKVSFADAEKEVIELNRWVRSILPEFTDLRTEFEAGVTLITLLRVIQPDRRPSLPYSVSPANPQEFREARIAAVQFAKELGARGHYDESVLVVRGSDPSELITFLRSVQRDVAGVSRETSAGLSPRRALRSQARERGLSQASAARERAAAQAADAPVSVEPLSDLLGDVLGGAPELGDAGQQPAGEAGDAQ